MNFRELI